MLEIACFNESSALIAGRAGADRIELCADYSAGGVTPPNDSVQRLRGELKIPVNVMIRPRPDNFVYSSAEFEKMKSDIQILKPDASGFVFGILNKRNCVDQERNTILVELAAPLPCTFHRAFDQVPDMHDAMQQVISCGFTSILTSGCPTNAVSGADSVAELYKCYGNKISIILGGGVRSSNVGFLKETTKVEWYHSAAITGPGEDVDEEEVTQLRQAMKHAA